MKRFVRYTIYTIFIILAIVVGGSSILYFSADMKEPEIDMAYWDKNEVIDNDSIRIFGKNKLQYNDEGLWEMYVEGTPDERGIAIGRLSQDLLYFQEKVFVDQIREIIPSDSYLKFLRYGLVIFNRNLGEYIPEEYRREISGIAKSCTPEFDAIGTPYERQLNYHAAHDIGHAMQQYMLVGCSSFGAWGDASADSTLVIGRNFDFFVGEDFAKNKLVSFFKPTEGYAFASVGWAGMIGVLSGMNEKGLTVTLNASTPAMPTSSATPISILARNILQYASNIEEAYKIAEEHKTFVSESLLIGSAIDGRAVVIEKTPDKMALFESDNDRIFCTNHYQSAEFANDADNLENIATSDSKYRLERLEELVNGNVPISPVSTAGILRNYLGKNNEDIGLKNEKALNQFIAHHAVIFQPEKLLMWVSTAPWQLGEMVAYNLGEIFESEGEIFSNPSLNIAEDELIHSQEYVNLQFFNLWEKDLRTCIKDKKAVDQSVINAFIESNSNYFYTYQLLGDYYNALGEKDMAITNWEIALTKEIPRVGERETIEKSIKKATK